MDHQNQSMVPLPCCSRLPYRLPVGLEQQHTVGWPNQLIFPHHSASHRVATAAIVRSTMLLLLLSTSCYDPAWLQYPTLSTNKISLQKPIRGSLQHLVHILHTTSWLEQYTIS
jgi:hypothetical protein